MQPKPIKVDYSTSITKTFVHYSTKIYQLAINWRKIHERSVSSVSTCLYSTNRSQPLGSSALDALGFFSTVRSISEETTHARGTVPFTKQQSTGKLFEEDRCVPRRTTTQKV